MSAPSLPPDNSVQIEQMQEQQQAAAQAAADKKAQDAKDALATLRTNSATTGRQSANDYFQGQGLDPTQYSDTINSRINSILAGISPDDPNPGASFQDVGPTIYGQAQDAYRTKEGAALNQLFPGNFETARAPLTIDDPYISSVEAEQRTKADAIIRNMLDRGVITTAGFNAGEADLDKQVPNVNSQLNEVGTNLVTGEQGQLRDIANKGRSAAQTLTLGQSFDPGTYGSEADTNFNDFVSKLGDSIRAGAPGNLFNTAGLAAIAGAGQGAQNLAFDPTAASGIVDPNDPNATKTPAPAAKESIF